MYGSCYNCAYKYERISDPNNAICITCNFGRHHISDGVVRLSNSRITGFFIIDYRIKNVIFNPPATIVLWADGTKTVVKAHGEEFDPEKGLAMAISKKVLGTGYYPEIKKWTSKYHQKKCYAEAWARKEKLDESMNKVAHTMRETGNTADTSRVVITMSKERWNNIMRGAIIDEDNADGDDFDETEDK